MTAPDARAVLRALVGTTITTLSGRENRVLAVEGTNAIVATDRSPGGQPVPILEVQEAIDQLFAIGSIEIEPAAIGYRSAFIGAVLQTLPGTTAEQHPAMIRLGKPIGDASWTLQPGDTIARLALHQQFGGNHDRGISSSARTPNIFIFSNPKKGTLHGYLDHWEGDVLHYYGEGRLGDQELSQGNKAIASHKGGDRPLRVFQGTGGTVTFLGTFTVDDAEPYYWTAGYDAEGARRRLVVFRLVPAEGSWLHGELPALPTRPLTHSELQAYLADLTMGAECEPLYPTDSDNLFEVGWTTPSTQQVVAEIRDFELASEEDVLSRGLGHLLLAEYELRTAGRPSVPVLFTAKKPSDPRWIAVCEERGVVLAWPGATQGIPLA